MLGVREPSVYGPDTLGDIEAACAERAVLLGVAVDFRQTNIEGEIVSDSVTYAGVRTAGLAMQLARRDLRG